MELEREATGCEEEDDEEGLGEEERGVKETGKDDDEGEEVER